MNAAGILLRVIDRPGQAMEGAVARPRSWLLPAVLLLLSMLALAYLSAPYGMEMANERQAQTVERLSSRMPEEQVKAMRERMTDVTLPRYLLTSVGVGVVVAALGWVGRGTIVHFSGMAAGGTSAWAATFSACVWSMMPFFVRDIVQLVYVLSNKSLIEHQGISFLVASADWMSDSQDLAYNALAHVEPFALWHIVLLTAAICAATGIGKGKGFVMAVVVWAVFVGLKLLPTAIGSAITGGMLG